MPTIAKSMYRMPALLLFFVISGCASLMVNMDNIEREQTIHLCGAYGHKYTTKSQREKIATELNRRKSITDHEWSLIKERKIQRGMSREALYASWGPPTKTNRSTGSWGTHIQHVYGLHSQYPKPSYVYTENGKVTSWQN